MHSIVGLAYLAVGERDGGRTDLGGAQIAGHRDDESGFDTLRRREIFSQRVFWLQRRSRPGVGDARGYPELEQADNAFLAWAISEASVQAEDWSRAELALGDLLELRWIFYETLVPTIQAHYRLGMVLDELGRGDEAVSEYSRFLELWGDSDSPIPEVARTRQRLGQRSP